MRAITYLIVACCGAILIPWQVAGASASGPAAGEGRKPSDAKRRIAAYEAAPPDAKPEGISKYLLDGRPLYLIPSPCCDQFNYLYTPEGRAICAPAGGITGRGDGRCPAGIKPASEAASGVRR